LEFRPALDDPAQARQPPICVGLQSWGARMSDPLMVLALAAVALMSVTFLLSRVVPDRYDNVVPQPVEPRRDERL